MTDESTPLAAGYGRPPRDKQFTKGKSGNPKGRPKKNVQPIRTRRFRREIIEMMEEKIAVKIDGKTVMMPLFIAHTRAQLIGSAQGKRKADLSAIDLMLRLVDEHELGRPDVKKTLDMVEEALAKENKSARKNPMVRDYLQSLYRQTRE